MVKWVGCCTLCEREVFDVASRHGPPFKGKPKTFNRPKPDAMRLTFWLSNETECDLTFCRDCTEGIEDKFQEIWARCLEAFEFENANRKALGADDAPELCARAARLIDDLSRVRITKLLRRTMWQSVV